MKCPECKDQLYTVFAKGVSLPFKYCFKCKKLFKVKEELVGEVKA